MFINLHFYASILFVSITWENFCVIFGNYLKGLCQKFQMLPYFQELSSGTFFLRILFFPAKTFIFIDFPIFSFRFFSLFSWISNFFPCRSKFSANHRFVEFSIARIQISNDWFYQLSIPDFWKVKLVVWSNTTVLETLAKAREVRFR